MKSQIKNWLNTAYSWSNMKDERNKNGVYNLSTNAKNLNMYSISTAIKKVSIKSALFNKDWATIKYIPDIMLNCIDSKNNASYNNHLTINTTNMKNISAVINTCTDKENNIFLTFSTTFVIDTPKRKEHYVDNYLHGIEKKINKMILILVNY